MDDYEDGYDLGYGEGVIDGHTNLLMPFKNLVAAFSILMNSGDRKAWNAAENTDILAARKAIALVDSDYKVQG